MTNKAVGIGCLGFLVFLVAAYILGVTVENKNAQSNSVKSTPTPENYEVVKAIDLAHSYHSNEVRADKIYDGYTMFIVGEITDIGKTITGAPYVMLEGKGKSVIRDTEIDIQVIFERSETDKISKLGRGDTIKAKATCNGLTLGDVILSNAELR
jgi:hypothetical protein